MNNTVRYGGVRTYLNTYNVTAYRHGPKNRSTYFVYRIHAQVYNSIVYYVHSTALCISFGRSTSLPLIVSGCFLDCCYLGVISSKNSWRLVVSINGCIGEKSRCHYHYSLFHSLSSGLEKDLITKYEIYLIFNTHICIYYNMV